MDAGRLTITMDDPWLTEDAKSGMYSKLQEHLKARGFTDYFKLVIDWTGHASLLVPQKDHACASASRAGISASAFRAGFRSARVIPHSGRDARVQSPSLGASNLWRAPSLGHP